MIRDPVRIFYNGQWYDTPETVECKIAEAVQAEREACAILAEDAADAYQSVPCIYVAGRIRARGESE